MNIKSLLLAVSLAVTPFASSFAEVVNINKASAATLQHYLKGIGEKKATSIVEYRTKNKEFNDIADIMNVKGIGEGIYKNIKADLSLTEGKVALVKLEKAVKKSKVKAKTQVANEEIASDVESVNVLPDTVEKVPESVKNEDAKKPEPKPVVAKIEEKDAP